MQQRVEAKRRKRSGGGLPGWLIGLLLGLIIGIAGGLGWAWVIQPLELANAAPSDLAPTGKRMWVDMAADSYAHDEDLALAQRRLVGIFTPEELAGLFYESIQEADSQGEIPQYQRRQNLAKALGIDFANPPAVEEEESAVPTEPDGMFSTVSMACGGGLLVAVILLGGAVFITRSKQSRKKPSAPKSSTRNPASIGVPVEEPLPESDKSPQLVIQDSPKAESRRDESLEGIEAIDELFGLDIGQESESEPDLLEFNEPEAPPASYSSPLDEFPARYNYGDDGYDMSFSIETAQTEFLGECGIGISESLNRGTPQEVTAFEVWLFDKDDIRTVTKVLLSEHASNNEQIRNRLAPKGELVVPKEGDIIDLETKSLRVQARIREIEYGQEGKPNAYFERLVIELIPQQKL